MDAYKSECKASADDEGAKYLAMKTRTRQQGDDGVAVEQEQELT
jgi:hypothetical protein